MSTIDGNTDLKDLSISLNKTLYLLYESINAMNRNYVEIGNELVKEVYELRSTLDELNQTHAAIYKTMSGGQPSFT